MPTLIRPGAEPTRFAMDSTLVTAEAGDLPVCSVTGEPLPRGSAIELGYFDDGTIFDLFGGRWVPIIGLGAPKVNRTISPIFVGHGGEDSGKFSWSRTFIRGIDALPPAGRPLALRLYDHPSTTGATFYNTVSHPSWWFREPKSPSPAFVFMSLDEVRLSWESGPDGRFRTALPIGSRRQGRSAVLLRALASLRRLRPA